MSVQQKEQTEIEIKGKIGHHEELMQAKLKKNENERDKIALKLCAAFARANMAKMYSFANVLIKLFGLYKVVNSCFITI
ncbi:CLUMA_CG016076, isoform A [Clunio marinus]|uniref:CLUMA_CG016076, isoform A n=1 Tax=Clunio marinus TaxID=568069 RepID=A0A1J1ISX3_9DIPT|nr:CLUMA_CG016076, isoform A [Clunio marinus]